MSAVDIGVRETVGIAEAQVHVGLGREVQNCVDLVAIQTIQYLIGVGYVALDEGEVASLIQSPRIVERAAVIQLIEGYDVVGIRVVEGEVPDIPRSTATSQSDNL